MAQRIVRRRSLPSGVVEIPDMSHGVPKIEPVLRSLEVSISSPAAGQPTAQTMFLPPGSTLYGVSYVTEVAWPTTTTLLDFGDQGDDDRFYADKNVDAEGSDYTAVSPGVYYPNGQTLTATITTTGATSTGSKTRIRAYYTAG